MEEESWRNHEGGIMEKESWRRNHGGGTLEEESWRRDLGGFWEAFRSPGRHPEAPRRPELKIGKMSQNHGVLLSKVSRPAVLAESGEGDMHDLRSLRTKVGARSAATHPDTATRPLH